jgi:NAD(P)-dependent dehydrogenase (short-subunit alcohol dehydrogenase family)
VIIGDINVIRGKALVEEVRKNTKNQNIHFLSCDVTKWQSQVDFFRDAAKLSPHGGIDAVVANAGIVVDNPTFDSPADNLGTLNEPPPIDLRVVEVNLIGAMYTAHLAFYYLPKNPGSQQTYLPPSLGQNSPNRDRHLLLIGSMAGIAPFPGQVEYCTAKHGITGLYRSLMCTAFTKGIRVNLIMPYFTDTPIVSTVARVLLAGGPVGKVASVVDAGTRLMGNNNIGGRALVVGPRANVGEDWTIVPESSMDGKAVTTWEVYGQDFEDVGKCPRPLQAISLPDNIN